MSRWLWGSIGLLLIIAGILCYKMFPSPKALLFVMIGLAILIGAIRWKRDTYFEEELTKET